MNTQTPPGNNQDIKNLPLSDIPHALQDKRLVKRAIARLPDVLDKSNFDISWINPAILTSDLVAEIAIEKPSIAIFVPKKLINQGVVEALFKAEPSLLLEIDPTIFTEKICHSLVRINYTIIRFLPKHTLNSRLADAVVRSGCSLNYLITYFDHSELSDLILATSLKNGTPVVKPTFSPSLFNRAYIKAVELGIVERLLFDRTESDYIKLFIRGKGIIKLEAMNHLLEIGPSQASIYIKDEEEAEAFSYLFGKSEAIKFVGTPARNKRWLEEDLGL